MTAGLVSLVVTVQPTDAVRAQPHLGRAVYAQFLRWLDATDPALASRWHDADGPKPYTCSSLVGMTRMSKASSKLAPDDDLWFRVTSLDPAISAVLLALAAQPPAEVDLDGEVLAVTGAYTRPTEHPWAANTSYHELAGPYLLAREPAPRRVRLRFAAPTNFRQNGVTHPFPLPGLVFGGLADRWNAFSPLGVSDGVRAFCETAVTATRFDLKTRAFPTKGDRTEVGSVGEVSYRILRHDMYWASVVSLLADYAFYAGVGRGTSAGMGQVNRLR